MQSPLPLGSHLFFLLLQCHLHFHLFSCHLHRTDVPFQECQIRHIRSPAMQVPVQTASIQLGSAGQIRLLSGILLRSFQKFRRKLQLLHSFLNAEFKNAGRTATTAEPTKTAPVVAIRFVIMEPQIAMVETTSAWMVPLLLSVTSSASAAHGTRMFPMFPERKPKYVPLIPRAA